MKILIQLFTAFLRIGSFTFGGGYAMLPMIQREIVQKHGWASDEEIVDFFAIGQVTPGVIAVNTATFVGYQVAGTLGALVATLGVIFTPMILITALSSILVQFTENTLVEHAFQGIGACVVVLIGDAVYTLAKKALTDKVSIAIFIGVTLVSLLLSLSPVLIVLAVGLLGALRLVFKKGGDKSCSSR